MVISVLIIIIFMVLDRVFYSTFVFISLNLVGEKLDVKSPLI